MLRRGAVAMVLLALGWVVRPCAAGQLGLAHEVELSWDLCARVDIVGHPGVGVALVVGLPRPGNGLPGAARSGHPALEHVPGGMGTYGSGFQISLRQLSWAAVLGGVGLAAVGYVAGDASYVAMGAMLGPMGLWGLYQIGRTLDYVTGESLGVEYGLRHYAEDIRYLYENHPARDRLARGLAARHPDLQQEFLWSLEAFRNPDEETPADRDFVEWCRGLEEE
ncbi:hypothetical protein ACFL6X_04045 [Candidatus Latescibacterota bacterium]